MNGKARGFTLLEVLVATAIMAIAVTTLLTALSTSLRNASRTTTVDRTIMLARQKMDELLSDPRLPQNMQIEGGWDEVVTGGRKAGWRAQISNFEKPPNAPRGSQILERIDLEVWWDSAAGSPQTFRLQGYRAVKLGEGSIPE